MKVNIIGKGIIPGLNELAPVYNRDLNKEQIYRIINFKQFRVFGADGIGLITRNQIDSIFENIQKVNIPKSEPTIVDVTSINEIKDDDEPMCMGIELSIDNEIEINDVVDNNNEAIEDIANEIIDNTEEEVVVVEEEVVENKSNTTYNSYNKKNKKKKNR